MSENDRKIYFEKQKMVKISIKMSGNSKFTKYNNYPK